MGYGAGWGGAAGEIRGGGEAVREGLGWPATTGRRMRRRHGWATAGRETHGREREAAGGDGERGEGKMRGKARVLGI